MPVVLRWWRKVSQARHSPTSINCSRTTGSMSMATLAGASEISRFGSGCPLRLAGIFDLQLTPHPGSVIGIVALSGGTPEFRVLQQLEPADDLCATLFCLHRLAWRLDLAPFGANALKIPSGGWFP